jgi:hypothetical protein
MLNPTIRRLRTLSSTASVGSDGKVKLGMVTANDDNIMESEDDDLDHSDSSERLQSESEHSSCDNNDQQSQEADENQVGAGTKRQQIQSLNKHCKKKGTLRILDDVIEIVNKNTNTWLELARRSFCNNAAMNILWIGCKDILSVVYFALSLSGKLKVNITIVVVEDINDLEVPDRLADTIKIQVVKKDFLQYKSEIDFFDVMYSTVVQTLSNTLKLKYFVFAFQHYREGSPLLLLGHPHLFTDKDDKPIFSKKTLVIQLSEFTSYISTDSEIFWGFTNGAGMKVVNQCKREVLQESARAWEPMVTCLPFGRISPPKRSANYSRISTKTCPTSVSLSLFGRTCVIKFCKAFGDKVTAVQDKSKYSHEYFQAAYFKV